jgi:hypothetical protein
MVAIIILTSLANNQIQDITYPSTGAENFNDYSIAQSWFTSSEVQTAGQILASVSYN